MGNEFTDGLGLICEVLFLSLLYSPFFIWVQASICTVTASADVSSTLGMDDNVVKGEHRGHRKWVRNVVDWGNSAIRGRATDRARPPQACLGRIE